MTNHHSLTKVLCLVAVMQLLATWPARGAAEEAASAAGTTQSAAQSAYNSKLICKSERVIGSNIPKRVCRTQAQVDAERTAAQEQMKDVNSQIGRQTGAEGG
ncbi:MAG TPA: hypothetical protein VFG38_06870 [Pseudomonadales bacterium]|nr:hypothetical protein [Pseudomonadales bacterium]